MKMKAWHWAIALVLSGVLHAGGAVFLLPDEPEVQVAGGEGAEIALAGSAFTDLTAAGDPAETLEPQADAASELTPVEPEVSEAEIVEPVDSAADAAPETQPTPSEETVPVELAVEENAVPIVQKPEPPEVDAATPEADAVKPVTPGETVTAMVDVPRPTPRPDYTPPEPSRTPAERTTQQARPAAGSGGRDRKDAQRGTAQSGQSANASGQQTASRAPAAGNRAVSNYPGQIVSRLRRALHYPRSARRQGAEGEVHVAFTVTRNGGVGNIRVVRGSGAPILDDAAIETVRRAAPFPAIPPGAGRDSWAFTVPLAFRR
ncbi:energy transducer TonB [Chelativorans sp. YIM 93263]|uniref:energy transducer TonB n=1 Tax=Chelativorans sp. YIM 93263 TaxID=2906648 RepID=UPI0023794A5D|nr:energy transducer TonB [Chelativorans sp. YIM 93263]